MSTSKPRPARRPLDPAGPGESLSIRLSGQLKAELQAKAEASGLSLSREIETRLRTSMQPAAVASPLGSLVEALAARLALFYGADLRDPDAGTALAAGVGELFAKLAPTSPGRDANAAAAGRQVAELTFGWLRHSPDAAGLRAAFFGDAP